MVRCVPPAAGVEWPKMRDTGTGLMGMSGILLVLCALAAIWPGNRRGLRLLAILAFVVFLVGVTMVELGGVLR